MMILGALKNWNSERFATKEMKTIAEKYHKVAIIDISSVS